MSLDNVSPTRMNLLARKAQIKLAAGGVALLEGKREALLKELIARARELRALRKQLHTRGRAAVASVAMARAVRGTPEVYSAGYAGRRAVQLSVNTEKVWGLRLGGIDQTNVVRTPQERGLGLLDTSSVIVEASESCEKMLEHLLVCAPKEQNLQIIGEEVRTVSRRINALTEYLLPKLRDEMRTIARVLDEREREDTFRLKRIKKKMADIKAAEEEAGVSV